MQDVGFKAMVSEIEASPELYRPSRFWDSLNPVNTAWLEELGLENFKRTVAQNYFNWLIVSHNDPQFRSVLKSWLRSPNLRPFLARLEAPKLLRTLNGIDRKFGAYEQTVYRLFVALLWEATIQEDRLGLTSRLEEPALGSPIQIRNRGRRISQDLANSIRECNAIARHCIRSSQGRHTVAELGAGYGRLGFVFLSQATTRYCIFDIPPALHVSQWYLSRLFPDRKVFKFRHFDNFADVESELQSADVAFLTPNQMTLFPDGYFDVFVSISTLPEMSPEQVSNYLKIMSRLATQGIYLKQWRRWFNDKDGFEFKYEQLVLSDEWKLVLDKRDTVQPHFQERAWTREDSSVSPAR